MKEILQILWPDFSKGCSKRRPEQIDPSNGRKLDFCAADFGSCQFQGGDYLLKEPSVNRSTGHALAPDLWPLCQLGSYHRIGPFVFPSLGKKSR